VFDLWADEASTYSGAKTTQRIDASFRPSRRSSTRESDEQLNEAKECDSVRYWMYKP
jgi:hypothetical protein